MISSGAFATTPACLRYQLREVIFDTLRQPRADIRAIAAGRSPRTFATCSQHAQEQSTTLDRPDSSFTIRRGGTSAQIIGKPGRRQQVLSEQLKTRSLDRPSRVVILRDVREERTTPSSDLQEDADGRISRESKARKEIPSSITPGEIEEYIAKEHVTPAAEEIDASLDALKPASPIVDANEFQALALKLTDGYTRRQLSGYLARIARPTTTKASKERPAKTGKKSQVAAVCGWQLGRTPLKQRRTSNVKQQGLVSKSRLADQLLRHGWQITVSSEEQEIGELEMVLQPWQIDLLLSVTHQGKPNYQSLFKSQLLIDASHVQSYRPDNVLRITARRQDAEEVSRQVQFALRSVHRFDFDLAVFKPVLGKRGWPRKLHHMYRPADLERVSNLTRSLIRGEDSSHIVKIYSFSRAEQDTARRLLLGLCEIGQSRSFDMTFDKVLGSTTEPGQSGARDFVNVPVLASNSVPLRYSGLELTRATQPIPMTEGGSQTLDQPPATLNAQDPPDGNAAAQSTDIEELETAIIEQLSNVQQELDTKGRDFMEIPKAMVTMSDWEAELCYILQRQHIPSHRPARSPSSGEPKTVIARPRIPGLESLATEFQPAPAEGDGRMIVVHMIPSAAIYDEHVPVPRVTVSFQASTADGDLEVTHMTVTLDEQVLRVPLPSQTIDVQFKRRRYVRVEAVDLAHDDALNSLRQMLNDAPSHAVAEIQTEAEISLRLPAWFVEHVTGEPSDPGSGPAHVGVPFKLERFETVQTCHMRLGTHHTSLLPPQNESIGDVSHRMLQDSVPRNIRLVYQEVDGGAVSSSHSSVSVIAAPPSMDSSAESTATNDSSVFSHQNDTESRENAKGDPPSPVPATAQLVQAVMHFISILTRANRGDALDVTSLRREGTPNTGSNKVL